MDKNGKLFGKISIIDIFTIVLIIAVCIGTVYKFSSPKTDVKAGEKILKYTLKIEGVREFTYEYYEAGLKCYDKREATKGSIGEIKSVRKEPFRERIVLQDGEIIYVEKPEAINIYLDIEVPGVETDNAFFANGTYELKAGSELFLNTRNAEVMSRVYSVGEK